MDKREKSLILSQTNLNRCKETYTNHEISRLNSLRHKYNDSLSQSIYNDKVAELSNGDNESINMKSSSQINNYYNNEFAPQESSLQTLKKRSMTSQNFRPERYQNQN